MPSMLDVAAQNAEEMFRLRERSLQHALVCNPNWKTLTFQSIGPALAGERGSSDQQQCIYQAIRLAVWESGSIPKPWSVAFAPPTLPVKHLIKVGLPWYRRVWNRLKKLFA